MSLRARLAPAVVLALVVGVVAGVLATPASAGSCPNEEVRAEQGSQRLPDCRAFELVTPEVKEDNSSIGAAEGNGYAFPDGDHFYYLSLLPLPGAQNGGTEGVLSHRTATGWENVVLAPPAGSGEPLSLVSEVLGAVNSITSVAFTADLSSAFLNSPFDTDAEDQDRTLDAYKDDLSTGVWTLAARPDTGPMTTSDHAEHSISGAFLAGVSPDGGHVLFEMIGEPPVAPGTPSEPHEGDMLYDRTGGHTYAVGVLPGGTIPSECSVELVS